MELTLKDSGIVSSIVYDAVRSGLPEDDAQKIYDELMLMDVKTGGIVHALNSVLIRSGYGIKTKDIFERLMDYLAARINVRVEPDSVQLQKMATQNINVEVMNNFDVPVVFEVTVEDRDNFSQIIYNKFDEGYFNNFSMEKVVDSGSIERFKFKLGRASDGGNGTILFVIVRSKEIEGLNWVGRLRVSFEQGEQKTA